MIGGYDLYGSWYDDWKVALNLELIQCREIDSQTALNLLNIRDKMVKDKLRAELEEYHNTEIDKLKSQINKLENEISRN